MALAANDWWWLRENLVAYRYACGLPDPSIDQWRSNYLAERHDATHLAWFGLYSLPRSSIRLRRLNVCLFTSRRVFFFLIQYDSTDSWGHTVTGKSMGGGGLGAPTLNSKCDATQIIRLVKLLGFWGLRFRLYFPGCLAPNFRKRLHNLNPIGAWSQIPSLPYTLSKIVFHCCRGKIKVGVIRSGSSTARWQQLKSIRRIINRESMMTPWCVKCV